MGLVVVGAVLFFVLRGGHGKKPAASTTSVPAASATSTATASTPTTPTTTTGTSASVVAQINLTPPASDKKSKAAGIAEVLNEGSTDGVAIVAQNVPPNATKPPNAYAVWLYNSQTDAKILGFVTPSVGKTGRLQTAGRLPSNASHYKQLIVTVETTAKPKTPGSIVLQGALTASCQPASGQDPLQPVQCLVELGRGRPAQHEPAGARVAAQLLLLARSSPRSRRGRARAAPRSPTR